MTAASGKGDLQGLWMTVTCDGFGKEIEYTEQYSVCKFFGLDPFRWRIKGLCFKPVIDAVFHKLSAQPP